MADKEKKIILKKGRKKWPLVSVVLDCVVFPDSSVLPGLSNCE